MNFKIIFVVSFLAFIWSIGVRGSSDCPEFKKLAGNGTVWYCAKTTEVAVKVPLGHLEEFDAERKTFGQIRWSETTCDIQHFDLIRTTPNSTNTVWSVADRLGNFRSGMSPHQGIMVWDVVESQDAVFVLSSQHSRFYLDVQQEDADGQWKNTAHHELGSIGLHVSAQLRLIPGGASVEITQKFFGEPERKVFEITADGLWVCHSQNTDGAQERP